MKKSDAPRGLMSFLPPCSIAWISPHAPPRFGLFYEAMRSKSAAKAEAVAI